MLILAILANGTTLLGIDAYKRFMVDGNGLSAAELSECVDNLPPAP